GDSSRSAVCISESQSPSARVMLPGGGSGTPCWVVGGAACAVMCSLVAALTGSVTPKLYAVVASVAASSQHAMFPFTASTPLIVFLKAQDTTPPSSGDFR